MKRAAWLSLLLAPAAWAANDFPTTARVEYVLECMRGEQAAPDTMYKCACAIDAIASKVTYEEWLDLSTVSKATTIAGERGGVLRDMKDGRKMVGTYRTLQQEARKHCFLAR